MADGKIVVTLKGGPGYDAPWIVVSGDSVPEVAEHLKNVAALGLYGETVAAAQLFTGSSGVPTSGGVTAQSAASVSTPPATTPQASGRLCKHGPRAERSGTSSRGPWKGYFCALPKNHPDRCQPEYEDR